MANSRKRVRDSFDRLTQFSLEQAYIVFAVIYFPCALLFNNRGLFAGIILIIYTLVMILVSFVLLGRFVLFLAKQANEHSGMYGSVLVMYVLDMLIPLVMMKFYAVTTLTLLPEQHEGFMCELVRFVRNFYFTYDVQHNLDLLIMASLVGVGVMALVGVRREAEK